MNDACKHDPYYDYEMIHGEPPVPNGPLCYYEDNTLCMYATEKPMVSHGAKNIIAHYFLGILSCRNATKSI